MKKNVLMLVIDELSFDALGKQYNTEWTASPFLDSLKEKSIYAENMFSQAPYTEGAIRGLLDGANVMDKPETLPLQVNCSNNLFVTLEANGYDLFSLCIDFKYEEQDTERFGDVQTITDTPIKALETNRLVYYRKLYQSGKMNKRQWYDVVRILEDSFWISKRFFTMILEDNRHIQYTKKVLHINWNQVKRALEETIEEENRFLEDKKTYVETLLSRKSPVPATSFQYDYQRNMSDKVLRTFTVQRFMPVYNKILCISRQRNKKNQKIPVIELWNAFKELIVGRWNLAFRHFYYCTKNYVQCSKEPSLIKLNDNFDKSKAIYTSYGTFEEYMEWQTSHKEKPYFAYLHFTDIHEPATFINLRATDKKCINENATIIEKLLKDVPESFKGQLNYFCAVRMIDDFLEKVFNRLDEEGILDNTYIILTSDHGSSYLKKEIRNDLVNVFYQEQYHVPFYLYGKNIKPRCIPTFTSTKDIPQTISHLLGFELAGVHDSNDILDLQYKRTSIMQEYLGGGCPDLYGRPVRFCNHDDNWRIVYWVKLEEAFEQGKIMEIYRIKNGIEEKNNLFLNYFARKKTQYLLIEIENRFIQIKNQILEK